MSYYAELKVSIQSDDSHDFDVEEMFSTMSRKYSDILITVQDHEEQIDYLGGKKYPQLKSYERQEVVNKFIDKLRG